MLVKFIVPVTTSIINAVTPVSDNNCLDIHITYFIAQKRLNQITFQKSAWINIINIITFYQKG